MGSPLESWLKKVHVAQTRTEVLRLLEEFRPMDWTDEQRAAMSKVYIRALEQLAPEADTSDAQKAQVSSADGPVWYEKM